MFVICFLCSILSIIQKRYYEDEEYYSDNIPFLKFSSYSNNFGSIERSPSGIIKLDDIKRAKENIKKYQWAKILKDTIIHNADTSVSFLTDVVINDFISIVTPGAQTFCPHCVKTGKNWNAKGSWRWNPKHPNQLKCGVCGHVFPSTEYPEDYVVTSKYDPRQSFAYITKVGPVKCLKYVSCSSAPSMIIRGYKISYIISRLTDLAYTYVITDEDKYASTVRKVLLQLAECLPKYLVAEGYPYNEFADCDPHYAALNLEKLPDSKCRKIAGPGVDPNATMFSGYWGAHRMSSNGDEGEKVKIIATSFDLTMASNVYSDADIETIKEKVLIESTYLAIGDKSINNKSVMNLAGAAIVGLITKSIKLIHFGIKGFLTSISDWFLKDGSTSQSAMYGHKVLSGLFDFGYAFTNYSDPLDYKEPDRYDQLNVATDTKYDQCWQNLIWTSYSTFYIHQLLIILSHFHFQMNMQNM